MKVLITGGRGFIGSYVTKVFEGAGHEVRILSNLSHPAKISEGREIVYGDVRYEYDVDRAAEGMDIIIHLAARINVDRSREFPRAFFDTNLLGTFNTLEVCRKRGIRLIYAATSEALGSLANGWDSGMSEQHPYSPDNPYGATKAAADMLCLGWHKSYDLPVTLLRSFNVTGIGQSYDKEGAFIPKTIESVINGNNPIIFGKGEQTRDYVWVEDVARAYLLLAEYGKPGVYHVGTGKEYTIDYIAKKVIEISDKDLKVDYVDARPKELKRLLCNSDKIRKLGWRPTKSIDEILKDMYIWRLHQSRRRKCNWKDTVYRCD